MPPRKALLRHADELLALPEANLHFYICYGTLAALTLAALVLMLVMPMLKAGGYTAAYASVLSSHFTVDGPVGALLSGEIFHDGFKIVEVAYLAGQTLCALLCVILVTSIALRLGFRVLDVLATRLAFGAGAQDLCLVGKMLTAVTVRAGFLLALNCGYTVCATQGFAAEAVLSGAVMPIVLFLVLLIARIFCGIYAKHLTYKRIPTEL